MVRLDHRRVELGGRRAARDADDHGRPVAIASPSAKKPALRSSSRTCAVNRAANATASGVEREPGQITASVTPSRAHSSTRVALKVACTLTGRGTPGGTAGRGPAPGTAARLHPDGAAVGTLRRPAGRVAHGAGAGPARSRRRRRGACRPPGDSTTWWLTPSRPRSGTSAATCSGTPSGLGWRCTSPRARTWRCAALVLVGGTAGSRGRASTGDPAAGRRGDGRRAGGLG